MSMMLTKEKIRDIKQRSKKNFELALTRVVPIIEKIKKGTK